MEQQTDRLAEIQEREKKATKGPWEVAPCSSNDEVMNVVAEYKRVEGGASANWIAELDAALDFDSDVEGLLEQLQANAQFIAHAREDIPYLVAEVQSLRAERDRLNKALLAWEDREAAVCPEDVGFEEVIKALEAERDTLLEALEQLEAKWRDEAAKAGDGWPDEMDGLVIESFADELHAVLIAPLSPQTAEETQG
jgi:DNA repair exonuclease SbcCD ATPase subunit